MSISKISTFHVHHHIPRRKKKSIFELNMEFWWCALPIHIWEIIWQHYGAISENAAYVNLFFYALGHDCIDWSEAIYMQYAIEDGWGMEYNPIKSCWFYQKSIWNRLCWDILSPGSCKLLTENNLFHWPPLLWRTPTVIQTVSLNAGTNREFITIYFLSIFKFL